MSTPQRAEDVKLISSLFSARGELLERAVEDLIGRFGSVDWMSPECLFDRTRYYEKEMGWPLYRRYLSFENLIRPEEIVEVKLKTNGIEKKSVEKGNRRINIDPGYISLERLVLATGKNYTHRIYLSEGIYADLTLIFQRGTFTTLPWTYRDYADPEVIGYFNEIRERYKQQIRGIGPKT